MTTQTMLPAAPQGRVPSGDQIIRASVSGAAIAGAWTGVYEAIRVRNDEITAEEALRATASSAAIGAGAGAIAVVASHVARSMPLLGLAARAASALYLASSAKKPTPAADGG